MSLETQVLFALKTLTDPLSQQNIVEGGVLQGLQITEVGHVSFVLDINTQYMNEGIKLKDEAEGLVSKLPGVRDVKVVLTAQRKAATPRSLKKEVPGVKHIVVVGS